MIHKSGPSLAIVVLAAGGASRFGSAKQLAEYQGKPLLQHAIDASLNSSAEAVYVVLGAEFERVRSAIDATGVEMIQNPGWHEGMASSIKQAVTVIGEQYAALLFLAGDQVRVGSTQLQSLIDVWQSQPDSLVAAKFDASYGIPAIFPQPFMPELLGLAGDKGGKQVLVENRDKLLMLDMPEASIDIDYPQDLRDAIVQNTGSPYTD